MPISPDTLFCCLIGEGPLLKSCIEILLNNSKIKIIAVATKAPEIFNLCGENGIPAFDQMNSFYAYMARHPFDLGFSINNDHILLQDILDKPRYFFVNYHNSLLPRYAGSNATAWAILNQEKIHGISWHVIEQKVDAGNILLQKSFPISAEETEWSLSIKCYQTAITSFPELLEILKNGSFISQKQNLADRTYYRKHLKPHCNGVIDFNDTAAEIALLVRALHYGNYENTLCCPKILFEQQAIVPQKVRIEPVLPHLYKSPGTLLEINKDAIKVATKDQNIIFSHFKTPLSLELYPQYQFPLLTVEEKEKLQRYSNIIGKEEKYWLNALQNIKPLANCDISEMISSFNTASSLPLVLFNLYKINNYQPYTIDYDISYEAPAIAWHGIFSSYIPINIQLQKGQATEFALLEIERLINQSKSHQTFCADIFMRYPYLSPRTPDVLVTFSKVETAALQKYKIIIEVSANKSTIYFGS